MIGGVLVETPEKVNGFVSTQSVIVYGIDNVEHVIKTVVPTDEWDVTPA